MVERGMAEPSDTKEQGGRNGHLAQVINVLRSGPASRTEIARVTGISRTTVSTVVADLREGGLVREESASSAPTERGGRPPVQVALEPLAGVAVGVDFDHDHVKVAAADLAHNVLATRHRDLDV